MNLGPLQGRIGVLLGTLIIFPAILITRPCVQLIVRLQRRWRFTDKWLHISGAALIAMVLMILGISTWFAIDWFCSRTRFVPTTGFRAGMAIGMIAPLSIVWICTFMAFGHNCSMGEEKSRHKQEHPADTNADTIGDKNSVQRTDPELRPYDPLVKND